MHSTDNPDDGYLGSGKILGYSIAKYGKENHQLEILEFLESRKELRNREKEIVNEELLSNPLNINLKYGGDGGSHGREREIWNRPGYRERVSAAQKIGKKKLWENPEYRAKMKLVQRGKENLNPRAFKGKSHSPESKRKIGLANSIAQAGERNSQFGSCWVTDGVKPIKIKKDKLDEYLANGYSRGRKYFPR